MLTKLRLRLKAENDKNGKGIKMQMSSMMHGALMKAIDTEYAARLHSEGLRPYSQCLKFDGDDVYWEVNVLNSDAYNMIILPLIDDNFKKIHLKKNNLDVHIVERRIEQLEYETLADDFHSGRGSRFFELRFVTPTAFKKDGEYVFYPNLRLIYGSLMRRYNFMGWGEAFQNEDLLEQLAESTSIVKYDLHSMTFPLEGVRVPGFVGSIAIKNTGNQTIRAFIELLLRFGEFSGVGMKTSLGMGAIEFTGKDRK